MVGIFVQLPRVIYNKENSVYIHDA